MYLLLNSHEDRFKELYGPIIAKEKELQVTKQAVDKITTLTIPDSLSIFVTCYADCVTIKFNLIDQLQEAVAFVKDIYPEWAGEISNIWTCCDKVLVAWRDPKFNAIDLWLETTIADFPPNLKGYEKNSWVKTNNTEYVFICEDSNDSND